MWGFSVILGRRKDHQGAAVEKDGVLDVLKIWIFTRVSNYRSIEECYL
jgi:hypothetical protein